MSPLPLIDAVSRAETLTPALPDPLTWTPASALVRPFPS